MLVIFKKLFFSITFNSALFFILIIGIQNNYNKSKVDLFIGETVKLPISFIVGTSFISGSLLGGFLNISFKNKD